MLYDTFISYASEDVAWARKLDKDLQAGGRRVFRDETRLQVGRLWESQLSDALDASQHLIVIWSAHAMASNWVHKEMGRFGRNSDTDPKRRMICINLEGRNTAYATYQDIEVGFGGDPAALDANKWNDLLARIKTAIDEDEGVERIQTVVLALTADEADPARPGGLSREHLDTIKDQFGIPEAEVRNRYKGGRLDWHPYAGELSIRTLLDQVIDTVNRAAQEVPDARFAWRPVSDDLWLESSSRRQEVAAALSAARLSLVVVDALSLKSPPIYKACMVLREYLKGGGSTWIFVPPVPSDRTMIRYRELVRDWSDPLLESYFNPPVPRRDQRLPHFGVFCGDDAEMKRLVLGAVGEYLGLNERTSKSPYIDYKGPGH